MRGVFPTHAALRPSVKVRRPEPHTPSPAFPPIHCPLSRCAALSHAHPPLPFPPAHCPLSRCAALSTAYRNDADTINATLALIKNVVPDSRRSAGGCGSGSRFPAVGWFEFGQLVSWLLARVWLLSWLYRLGVYITFKAVLLRGATQVLHGTLLHGGVLHGGLLHVGVLPAGGQRGGNDKCRIV